MAWRRDVVARWTIVDMACGDMVARHCGIVNDESCVYNGMGVRRRCLMEGSCARARCGGDVAMWWRNAVGRKRMRGNTVVATLSQVRA